MSTAEGSGSNDTRTRGAGEFRSDSSNQRQVWCGRQMVPVAWQAGQCERRRDDKSNGLRLLNDANSLQTLTGSRAALRPCALSLRTDLPQRRRHPRHRATCYQNTHSLTHAACVLPRPTTRDAASQNMFLFINKTTITTQISQQYVACIEACTDIRSPAPPVLESILTVSDTFRWLVRTLKPD